MPPNAEIDEQEPPAPPTRHAPASRQKKTPGPREVVIETEYPVSCQGVQTNKITMRRPQVRDRLITEKKKFDTDMETDMDLLSSLTGMGSEELQDMDMADYLKLVAQLKKFILPEEK